MRFTLMIFLLSLSCVCLTLGHGSIDDCCLTYVKEMPRIRKHAVSYIDQVLNGGCNIPAVIFVMRRGRKYCTNPTDPWVKALKKEIDKRKPRYLKPRRKPNPPRPNRG